MGRCGGRLRCVCVGGRSEGLWGVGRGKYT